MCTTGKVASSAVGRPSKDDEGTEMKLRIKGNSLRLRVSQSDVAALIETGRIEETIYFAPGPACSWTYALTLQESLNQAEVFFQPLEVVVALPRERARAWAEGEQVGIYQDIDLGARGALSLIVEKDFACLDETDEANRDAFPNPKAQAVC